MTKGIRTALACAMLCTTWLPVVAAGDLHYVLVAQPLFDPNEGIFIGYQTYIDMADGRGPGREVQLTCAANSIPGGQGLDQNVAHLVGFTIQVTTPDTVKRHVDTLDVTIDVSHRVLAPGQSPKSADAKEEGFEQALRATIECMLDNAARDLFGERHVRLRISGPPRYQRFARVYDVGTASAKIRRPRAG